ncbi:hypothetical protein [Paenarthrobacter sp. PH39-S1]|uniref:hypothetical protein n=1 Tax=Paenarthrobacter sp. PH39-S1 TaxID=3046204 RepID=UPI0024B92665|nr:hypothetical protein [Paenarthrobacter sp. PH39-S1]MDJ0357784.1 hypothetical protein [Paenarthrobacter sp. PH39-S1]
MKRRGVAEHRDTGAGHCDRHRGVGPQEFRGQFDYPRLARVQGICACDGRRIGCTSGEDTVGVGVNAADGEGDQTGIWINARQREQNDGKPTSVQSTNHGDEAGVLGIDFPGGASEDRQ